MIDRKFVSITGVVLILFTLLMGIPPVKSVNAQQGTLVLVMPESTSLKVGETGTVMVDVINGMDLNAYDIIILYDAAVVSLDSWSHGTYFSSPVVVYKNSVPGCLQLAATQVGKPGVSGDGTILNLVFRGVAEGVSEIVLGQAQLVTYSNELVLPETGNGFITVSQYVSPTFTTTHTSTPTNTAMPTSTRQFTSTVTPTKTYTPIITSTPKLEDTPKPEFTQTITVVNLSSALPTIGLVEETATKSPDATSGQQVTHAADGVATGQTAVVGGTGEEATINGGQQNKPQNVNKNEDEIKSGMNTLLWVGAVLLVVILLAMVFHILENKKSH